MPHSGCSYGLQGILPLWSWILPTTLWGGCGEEQDSHCVHSDSGCSSIIRVILHVSASRLGSDMRHRQRQLQILELPPPSLLVITLPLTPTGSSPLGALETERSVKRLPWPLSPLSSCHCPSPWHGVEGAPGMKPGLHVPALSRSPRPQLSREKAT